MDLVDDVEDLYEEKAFRVEEQDLRILKALVSDDAAARAFVTSYDHTMFLGDAQSFAQKVISYYKGYKTLPTRRVMLEIAGRDTFLKEEINFVWDELDRVKHNPSEFKWDLDKIKDRYTGGKLYNIRNSINNLGSEDVNYDEHLRTIRAELDAAEKIRKGRESSYTQKTLRDYLPEFREDFVRKSQDAELGKGILTQYSYLDYVTNGMSPSDMLIVAAETGGGKSMLLSNMAIQMWMQGTEIPDLREKEGSPTPKIPKKGFNVQYFSLEMPYEQCFRRVMARLSGISTYGLRDCQITDPNQLDDLSKAAKFIKSFPFDFEIVDIPRGVTIRAIEERYLEAVAKGRAPDVIVVDYLGLMEVEGGLGVDDWLKLGHVAGQLHEFARMYNVVVLTAVQLNRPKGKDPSEIIGLHRIGRSSLIMHHATVGVQIETRKEEETYPDMVYHIIKNRNGERGNHILKKDFRSAKLVDMKPYEPFENDNDFTTITPVMEDISSILDNFGFN